MLLSLAVSVCANAACFGENSEKEMGAIERVAFRNSSELIRRFDSFKSAPNLQSAINQAQLHIIKGEAQVAKSEADAAAQSALAASVLLGPNTTSDLAIRLKILSATTLKDYAAQIVQMDSLVDSVKDRPLILGCLLYERGWSQYVEGHIDKSLSDLIRAHALLREFGKPEDKALVQARLATIYQRGGDPAAALELVGEAIDVFRSIDASQKLSDALFARAQLFTLLKRLPEAEQSAQEGMAISKFNNDLLAVGSSQIKLCHIASLQGDAKRALAYCDDAEKTLGATDLAEEEDRVQIAILRTEITKGISVPPSVLLTIDKAIKAMQDKPTNTEPRLFHARALIHAARAEYQLAFEDLSKSIVQIREQSVSERRSAGAILRVRFETDRAVQDARDLKIENTSAHRKLWLALILAGTAVVALGALVRVSILNRRQHNRLKQLAEIDSLTGIANRRKILETAGEQMATCSVNGEPLVAALIDIDFFKRVNDQYGHAAGDSVLKQFVNQSQLHIRKTDVIGRYGGEEFLLLMPNCSIPDASKVIERLREAIASTAFTTADGQNIQFSVSIGLTQAHINDQVFDTLVQRADTALYAAKEAGRNRLKIYDALWKNIVDPHAVMNSPSLLV